MRVVFFGTPEFAVPSLRALLARHQVAAVVTRPDRPAGRGMALRRSPVAEAADEAGVEVLQPRGARDPGLVGAIQASGADAIVVAAYGRILPPEVLEATPGGGLNVHASLLPRWRGASPIAAAILAGDAATGVSIMRMEEGLDTGPVLLQRRLRVAPDDTTRTLTPRLAELGAEAIAEGLDQLEAGTARFQPQPDEGVTYAPVIGKADGDLTWELPAGEIDRRVRAYDPWPGVRLPIGGHTVRVLEGDALPSWSSDASVRPGDVLAVDARGLEVMAADAPFLVRSVQPPGKRAMAAAEYARGRRDLLAGGAP
ncbi:MAG TPA: methionyl-tRNA formyltransferase [Candidatus Dormibacteraeota bacterium]|nr:methionyl-tRNA formyltransferase [Candidatus Dormibacteraeota bacterium]